MERDTDHSPCLREETLRTDESLRVTQTGEQEKSKYEKWLTVRDTRVSADSIIRPSDRWGIGLRGPTWVPDQRFLCVTEVVLRLPVPSALNPPDRDVLSVGHRETLPFKMGLSTPIPFLVEI